MESHQDNEQGLTLLFLMHLKVINIVNVHVTHRSRVKRSHCFVQDVRRVHLTDGSLETTMTAVELSYARLLSFFGLPQRTELNIVPLTDNIEFEVTTTFVYTRYPL